jgi:hypothetical protein
VEVPISISSKGRQAKGRTFFRLQSTCCSTFQQAPAMESYESLDSLFSRRSNSMSELSPPSYAGRLCSWFRPSALHLPRSAGTLVDPLNPRSSTTSASSRPRDAGEDAPAKRLDKPTKTRHLPLSSMGDLHFHSICSAGHPTCHARSTSASAESVDRRHLSKVFVTRTLAARNVYSSNVDAHCSCQVWPAR